MRKKIIILNGSPRKTGNTTALTAEFKKGVKEAGNTITEFFLDDMNINGCKGCFGGGKNPDSPASRKTIWVKFILYTRKQTLLFLQHHFTTGQSAGN